MEIEEVSKFVEQMRSAGRTEGEIVEMLTSAGWKEAEIQTILGEKTFGTIPSLQSQPAVKPKTKWWIWLLLALVFMGIGGYLALRAFPYLLLWGLNRDATKVNSYKSPDLSGSPNSSPSTYSFPDNLLNFQLTNRWYLKEEEKSKDGAKFSFGNVDDQNAEEDEKPPSAMEIQLFYPSRLNSKTNNLNSLVSYMLQQYAALSNPDNIAVYALLEDKSIIVDGLPAHQFDYKVDINKRVTESKKQPDGSFITTENVIQRKDRGREIIFFDKKNNLFQITFPVLESDWVEREPDFRNVISSIKVKYR